MNKLEQFDKVHAEAMEQIQQCLSTPEDSYDYGMVGLAKWMLNTDQNPYQYLQQDVAGWTKTATGFVSLLDLIHHALYDDGDIEFVKVNGQPKIVFVWRHDDGFYDAILSDSDKAIAARKGLKAEDIVEVMDNIIPREFIEECEKYQLKHIQKCYITDAARRGVQFADAHYSQYKCWEEDWRHEFEDEIRWKRESFEKMGVMR
jgi:hypothetical protein